MSAKIIDGKELSRKLRDQIKSECMDLKIRTGRTPGLTVILVGEDPASCSYVKGKEKACEEVGIRSNTIRLPVDTAESKLLEEIDNLNRDSSVDGILVQLPLPKHINVSNVINAITPWKDVDGFTYVNIGKMISGEKCFLPCTPHGILKLIKFAGIDLNGKKVTVIGRSNIVGKPIANLLSRKQVNATVTWCHTGTKEKDLHEAVGSADVVIVATGCRNTFDFYMLKKNSVLIDVGVNRVEDKSKKNGFRLVGDVYDSADIEDIKRYFDRQDISYTPVPGGVGPMTITMLLWNTLESAKKDIG